MKDRKRRLKAALRRAIKSCIAYNGEINLKRIATRNKCSPKTVSRALRELQKDGIVSVERRTGRGLLVRMADRARPAGAAPTAKSVGGAFGWAGLIDVSITVEHDAGLAQTGFLIDGLSGGATQTMVKLGLWRDISPHVTPEIPNTIPPSIGCTGGVLVANRGYSDKHEMAEFGIPDSSTLLPDHWDSGQDSQKGHELSTLRELSTLSADHPDGTQCAVNPDFSSISGEKKAPKVSHHLNHACAQNRASNILDIKYLI